MLKKCPGKSAFRYFVFHLGGSHYRKVAQEQHLLGATNSQSPPPTSRGSAFLNQTIGSPNCGGGKTRADISLSSVSSLAPRGLCHTWCHVTSFQLTFRNMWLELHKREWSLSWICLSWKSLSTGTLSKNPCVPSLVWPSARCVLSVPVQTDLICKPTIPVIGNNS